jgi:hypothetical protein
MAPSPYAAASDEKRRSTGNGRSGGFLRQNLGEQAVVLRVQVLNHDERHTGGGNGAEKLNQRLEASG